MSTYPFKSCLDKGYDYDEVRDLAREFGYTAHIRARGEEAQAIKHEAGFKARRWVVERTHSWMNRFRRILIRWEKKPENYLRGRGNSPTAQLSSPASFRLRLDHV